jgi:hypothetical protein
MGGKRQDGKTLSMSELIEWADANIGNGLPSQTNHASCVLVCLH